MRVQILSVGMWFGLVAMACSQPPQSGSFGAGNGPQYGPPAMGGPGGPPPNAMFTAMDADGDGAISMRELRKAVVALKQLDADKDGKITQAEATGGPPDPQAMIDRVMENDKDGDGKLSKSEVPRHLAQMIGGADTNGDGSIDRAELTTAMQNAAGPNSALRAAAALVASAAPADSTPIRGPAAPISRSTIKIRTGSSPLTKCPCNSAACCTPPIGTATVRSITKSCKQFNSGSTSGSAVTDACHPE